MKGRVRDGIGKRDKKNKGFDQCKKKSEIKRILSFYMFTLLMRRDERIVK